MEVKKERSRNWFVLLYPDNPDHVKALEKIPEVDYEFVGVLHDSDKLDDGSPAKPHNHVLLKFKDAVWNTAIAETLGIELRFLQKSDNWKRSARYLVHKDHPEKFQYDKAALFGSMVEQAISAIAKSDPEEEAIKVAQIISMITETDGFIDDAEFVKKICEKKLYAEFRRGGQVFLRMIDKHNRTFANIAFNVRQGEYDRKNFARFVAENQRNDKYWVERCQMDYQLTLPLEDEKV